MYLYGQIALAIVRAITGHTRTSKSTDYCPNCTQKCVINYTNVGEAIPLPALANLQAAELTLTTEMQYNVLRTHAHTCTCMYMYMHANYMYIVCINTGLSIIAGTSVGAHIINLCISSPVWYTSSVDVLCSAEWE